MTFLFCRQEKMNSIFGAVLLVSLMAVIHGIEELTEVQGICVTEAVIDNRTEISGACNIHLPSMPSAFGKPNIVRF